MCFSAAYRGLDQVVRVAINFSQNMGMAANCSMAF